jgi:rfaE bifunctional protein kinase chain/domain
MGLDEYSLSKIDGTRVLVVGDCMLDRYWMGDVNRISPEAPVPVISVQETEKRMGGAANVAKNIASVGGRPLLLSIVGDDEAGRELEQMLEQENIESRLHFDADMNTTVKLRMVSRNQQLLRADFESSPGSTALEAGLKALRQSLGVAKVLLVSDYGKGGTRYLSSMIKLAKERDIAVYIDPKGHDYSAYKGAALITPNLHEFQQVAGEVYELDDINQAAQGLMQKLDLQACLVTLSERGMLLCQRDAAPIHQLARAREVYDVTGAGDTVIAMMALARASKMNYEQAIGLANHAAGIVVSKMGTATASLPEIVLSMERT